LDLHLKEDVSIVIPLHGNAPFLEEALNSVENQDCTLNFLIYIVLDRPSDSTLNLINKKRTNSLYNFIQSSGLGLVAALNSGVKASRGSYIARFDSDDFMSAHRIQKQFDFMKANPDVVVVGSSFIEIDKSGNTLSKRHMPVPDSEIRKILMTRSPFAHPSVMIRSSSLKHLDGPYRPKYLQAEDHDLWLRLSDYGLLANIDEVLLHYRRHDQQYSSSQSVRQALFSRFAVLSHMSRQKGNIPIDERFDSLEDWLNSPNGRLERIRLIAFLRSRMWLSNAKKFIYSKRIGL
jgi:glycosyltransferase involved in cell wall biosynthesis